MQNLVSPPKPLKPFIYTYCCQVQPSAVKISVKQPFSSWIHTPASPTCIAVFSTAVLAPAWPFLRAKSARPGFLQVSSQQLGLYAETWEVNIQWPPEPHFFVWPSSHLNLNSKKNSLAGILLCIWVYALHKMGFLVPSRAYPWGILSTELPWKLWCKGKIYFAGAAWVNYFKYRKGCECSPDLNVIYQHAFPSTPWVETVQACSCLKVTG